MEERDSRSKVLQGVMLTIAYDYHSERSRMTAPHVSKEEEGKWRCHECKKLFKAAEFVEKHVLNKHEELCKTQLEEVCVLIIMSPNAKY